MQMIVTIINLNLMISFVIRFGVCAFGALFFKKLLNIIKNLEYQYETEKIDINDIHIRKTKRYIKL